MLVLRTCAEAQAYCQSIRDQGQVLAFVPTMGALHSGHIALINDANAHAQNVLASIFVNPTQFDRQDDFDHYPRREEEDIALLRQHNASAVFIPDIEEMYNEDNGVEIPQALRSHALCNDLCGQRRPGHFVGVMTIVSKLLALLKPNFLVLGEKDYQQLILVKQLLEQEHPAVHLLPVATQREASGLAYSSRNARLSAHQRKKIAPLFYKILQQLATAFVAAEPEESALRRAIAQLEAAGFRVEYLERRSAQDLSLVREPDEVCCVLLSAVWLGDVRLIDQLAIPSSST